MKRLLFAAALAPLVLAAPVLGSRQVKMQRCTASLLNLSGRTLELRRSSSAPAWHPGFVPQPRPEIESEAAVYWWTVAGPRGCWNHVVYHSGRRVIELTVEGRVGHRKFARCVEKGFRSCTVLRRTTKAPQVFLSVRLT